MFELKFYLSEQNLLIKVLECQTEYQLLTSQMYTAMLRD